MEFRLREEKGFRYVDVGEGPVILLLHGLFGALSNFEQVINQFSVDFRVVIPIMPVYDLPLLRSNVRSLARFVHKFVQFKELDQLILLGNSLGGHVALLYVLSHPEKVRSMILTGSSGLYENSFGGSFPRRESYDFIKEKVQFTFYDPHVATKELVDEVFEIVNTRNKLIRVLAMAKSAIRHNLRDLLCEIRVPVSLIWGRNDRVTPPEVAIEFNSLLPNSELNWIDCCGHAPMMEQPQEFNDILSKFVGGVNQNLKVG